MDIKDINIIHEDKHIIVAEKPPKVPSQGDPSGDPDMLTLLCEHVKREHPQAKNPYIGLVHRIDRPVGGAMVFAKTKEANAHLSKQMQEKTFKKYYMAVVCGVPENERGELRDILVKNAETNMSRVVKEKRGRAKEAVLEYEVIKTVEDENEGPLTLLKVELKTGRHHQIRVQLSHAGFAIWGDTKYNKAFTKRRGWSQIALWSHSLRFMHPKTKKPSEYVSMPHDEFPFSLFKNEEE